jgi:hypothetical protein
VVPQRKWNWRVWLGIILVLIAFLVLSAPQVIRCPKKSTQTEAVNNARQIGLALFEFESEYGNLPDEKTIAQVLAKKPTDLHLGTKTSNDLFRQLLASGVLSTEQVFYANVKGTRKPDNIITAGQALKKGECGFSYLLGLNTSGSPARPLLVTPLIPGTDRFDPKPFQGKAVILKIDNSVSSMPIHEDGHVWVNGMNLLHPNHSLWEGQPPVIVWPE